ncbi:hypothetical protein MASRES_GEN12915_15205 [Acinetobacter baumannii]
MPEYPNYCSTECKPNADLKTINELRLFKTFHEFFMQFIVSSVPLINVLLLFGSHIDLSLLFVCALAISRFAFFCFRFIITQKRKPRQTTGLQTLNLSTLSAFFLIEHVRFIFPNMKTEYLPDDSEHVNLQKKPYV